MSIKVVEVKIFEKARADFHDRESRLDGTTNHPDRYVYVKCWLYPDNTVKEVGTEGYWPFVDGKCEGFGDRGDAEIIGEVDDSRWNEPDRFEAVQ